MSEDIELVAFTKAFSRENFSCGKPDLDEWLRAQAPPQQKTGNTRTFLVVSAAADRVVGYYSMTTYRLELDEAALAYGVGKRRHPIPAVLLARLALDESVQGRSVGARLLIHALTEIARAPRSVGFEILVVHAIDEEAVTFYARFGFTRFDGHPLHLFMPVKNLLATVSAS